MRRIAFIRNSEAMKIQRNILLIGCLLCLGLSIWDSNRPHPIKVSAAAPDIIYSMLFSLLSFLGGIVLLNIAYRTHKKIRNQEALVSDFLPGRDEQNTDVFS